MSLPRIQYIAAQDWNTEVLQISAGTAFTPLGDIPANEVQIVLRPTDVALDVMVRSDNDATKFVTLDPPFSQTLQLSANIAEVQVRRNDQLTTPTNVRFFRRLYRR